MLRYFMIMCHRGHCGTGHSTEIKFAIKAKNLREAYTKLVIYGKEITEQEYIEFRQVSAYKRFNQRQFKGQ